MPELPVLLQVLIVFALVVAAAAKKVHLGLAAAFGGILFAVMRGLEPGLVLRTVLGELFDPDTLLLLLLVTAIMALSSAMKKSGALHAFSRAVAFVAPGKRASMVLTPLLIGTLPMPGGALLSAPLVDALDPERSQGAERLASANYWFRHSLELSWPLYPAFILTCTMSGFSPLRLSLLNLYAPFLLIALGLVFVTRREGRGTKAAGGDRGGKDAAAGAAPRSSAARPGWREGLAGFLPLAVVLGVYILLDAAWKLAAPAFALSPEGGRLVARYLPILLGVAAGGLYVALAARGFHVFAGTVNLASLKLALIVAGIRVFSALLEAGGVADAGAAELAAWGIPPLLAALILPFVAGLVTGVGFGYVGLAFPLVLGLFPAEGGLAREAVVVLAGAFGYAGMMLSPLHVCMVVSAEHFSTGIGGTIRRIAPPLGLFVLAAGAYAALLARLFG